VKQKRGIFHVTCWLVIRSHYFLTLIPSRAYSRRAASLTFLNELLYKGNPAKNCLSLCSAAVVFVENRHSSLIYTQYIVVTIVYLIIDNDVTRKETYFSKTTASCTAVYICTIYGCKKLAKVLKAVLLLHCGRLSFLFFVIYVYLPVK
jgi:hypothetical protein